MPEDLNAEIAHRLSEGEPASATRIKADEASTAGGRQRLLDVSTFNIWIQAQATSHEKVAALYVRRFSPEYRWPSTPG